MLITTLVALVSIRSQATVPHPTVEDVFRAVNTNNTRALQKILAQAPSLARISDGKGRDPLYEATDWSVSTKTFSMLLAAGAVASVKYSDGYYIPQYTVGAMARAPSQIRPDIITRQIEKLRLAQVTVPGILSKRDSLGGTAMTVAVGCGYVDVVRALMHMGGTDSRALICARTANMLRWLLDRGFDPKVADGQYGPLSAYAALGQDLEGFRILIRAGAKYEASLRTGETPLHFLATNSELTLAQVSQVLTLLRPLWTSPNERDLHGRTALVTALDSGDYAKALLFLQVGIDPCLADVNGQTPLHAAFSNLYRGFGPNFLTAVKALLKGGASLTIKNKWGKSPVMYLEESDPDGSIAATIREIQPFLKQQGVRVRSEAEIYGTPGK